MGAQKPKVVVIGAGMAGLTAAHKLYTTQSSRELFDLSVVEGGKRVGGRINTSEFCGDRIEMGATWIHGIQGSPVYKIAQETNSLQTEKPWECMDGFSYEKMSSPTTIAEGGLVLNPSVVKPMSSMFEKLLRVAQTKEKKKMAQDEREKDGCVLSDDRGFDGGGEEGRKRPSMGSFLRKGLEEYWESMKGNQQGENISECCADGRGNWSERLIEEAIFAMHENIQRTYTGASDLFDLDYNAECEYEMFPGEEITVPKGYTRVIDWLASSLPSGLVQTDKKVLKIEWDSRSQRLGSDEGDGQELTYRPLLLHFSDGSSVQADHVIVTVSLGVLKAGIREESSLFSPPLPGFKKNAISRLGYGVVNKLFVEVTHDQEQVAGNNLAHKNGDMGVFPFMQMVFHRPDSEFRQKKLPWWIRRTHSLYPIYTNSRVLLSWFAGKEALELESLDDEAIINGVSTTISSFMSSSPHQCKEEELENHSCQQQPHCSEKLGFSSFSSAVSCSSSCFTEGLKLGKILRTKWGSDPLFLGSYSYVAVGASGGDLDTMALPLPIEGSGGRPLQIMFAGEATHRTHYSTTHGAYLSGLREANRLLQHYHHQL